MTKRKIANNLKYTPVFKNLFAAGKSVQRTDISLVEPLEAGNKTKIKRKYVQKTISECKKSYWRKKSANGYKFSS